MKKFLSIVMLMAMVAVAGCGSKKKAKETEQQKEVISRHFIESEEGNKENYTPGV